MRLRRLLIEQYGSFERLDLALAAEPGRINLVVAPNGAGKSVLRQAFHDLLFGYVAKSKMNFRYRSGLSLHAEAIMQAGEDLRFGWRHPGGRAFPGTDADAATRFGTALGGIRPPQLEHLFALDTARLRAGGEELAQGGDSLGLALLSGTGELMSAKAARTELAARRESVWAGSRLSSKPLARAAKSLDDARKRTRSAVQLPAQRARELGALADQAGRLQQARASHAAMQEKASRLARIDRTRRFLEEHRSAAQWLAANPDAPLLHASLADDLTAARGDVALAVAKHADTKQALADADAALAALVQDPPALDRADDLESLRRSLERVEAAAGDLALRQSEREAEFIRMRTALRELGVAVPVEQVASLLPRLADETTARQLIAQYASRSTARETDERRLRQAQAALDHLEAAALAAPAPQGPLEDLRRAIFADGDPARHLAEAARAEREANGLETAALSAVPGWSGKAAELRQQLVLPSSAYERLDAARTQAAAKLADLERQRDRVAQERAAWQHGLQDMHARPLPDAAALARSRSERDRVWHLIYRRHYAGDPDPAQEQALASEGVPLAYARLVREADALVDLRLHELPRAKEMERLARELERTAPEWNQLATACEAARAALETAADAFSAPCAALGLDRQASLGDVRHALTQRTAAIAAGVQADAARAAHQAVLAGQADWAGQLRRLLPSAARDASFPALLASADALLKAEADARSARIQHEANRQGALRAVGEAQADLRASEQALDEWRQRWAACLAALGRPGDETPAATEAVLQCLTGLAASNAEAERLGKRIAEIQALVSGFAASVAALAGQLSLALEPDIFTTARRLIARDQAAQTQRTLAAAAQTRLLGAREALSRAADSERDGRQRLGALIAACGAADADDAERRIAASRERSRQEGLRDGAVAGLREHGDGLSIAMLQAEAEAVTPDQAASEREQTQRALAEARDVSEEAAGRARDLQRTLDRAAEATDATEAVLGQEAAAASFGRLLDDYLVLSLAEQMLTGAIGTVEAQAGSNGVSRISAAFARVTNDDYAIQGEEGPDGKTVLVAIERHWPNEKKALSQLSEGTRDQLYLALRIVAIEDHVAAGPPLPFIADDILQTFDDARALAALHALLALSRHTQIIILTHHPHLAVLAGSLPAGSVHLAAL